MEASKMAMMDGNEAAAYVAYRVSEVCAIYPITPSSTMAELADQWSAQGLKNIWGNIPVITEMQSEAGVAGAVHGALQTGALTTTFTASQGLMLMIPNMYKIAGELTPVVFHVAARSLAAQGLSIFGDHADVMAIRQTGFALLVSNSVQEAHDMALIAHAVTLESRIPFIHFFDGFRTSHEINKLKLLSDAQIRAMIDDDQVRAHRARGLNPDNPVMRGTAQNPDIYFQGRETVNPFYTQVPSIVKTALARFADLTGREYHLYEYYGDPQAQRLIIAMGSATETLAETAAYLQAQGEQIGILQIRLSLPLSAADFLAAIPDTVQSIAVLDRCKSPGSVGEPLYLDVVTVFNEARRAMPRIIGGRYGLSSKEFTPAMVQAIFAELGKDQPKNHFTIGIKDDVGHSSLDYDPNFNIEADDRIRAVFIGLGADGTVGANKNSVKIIGADPDFFAQAYFVYDSKKSGSRTVSHLRFGKSVIKAPYLIEQAHFVACSQFNFLDKTDVLKYAAPKARLLLNSPYAADQVWAQLPRVVQAGIIKKQLRLYVIDATAVAKATGMGRRTNTIMQTCFFALSGIMPEAEAITRIKAAIEKTYSRKGQDVVAKNFQAVDSALAALAEVNIPQQVSSRRELPPIVAAQAPDFVQTVTAEMMADRGDDLPVSMIPIDGTYPTGTTRWEKRNIAIDVPVWSADLCIQCGQCSMICPHAVIRARFFHQHHLDAAPKAFQSAPLNARGFPEIRYSLNISARDCTGCYLCVEACPVDADGRKAITMQPNPALTAAGAVENDENLAFFQSLAVNDRARVDFSSVRGAQFLTPLFEYSGACAGCGETPYLRLLSQLFGDRLLVANATGCSSIYGGNLPTTPWTKNEEGKGPAWSNSLFEDNAEFGYGFRLSADQHLQMARDLALELADELGKLAVQEIIEASQQTESEIRAQRARVAVLKQKLQSMPSNQAKHLLSVVDHLIRRSVWAVGGDGWAYDIGSAGLDHVLASGRDINILVMDTEVYSNTGGQTSKSTPLAAVAKFSAAGKTVAKKDIVLQAIAYGNVYVAHIAIGANPQQALLALREAEAYPGPSLILSYSHCIAHGIQMQDGIKQQKLAVNSGHWPLIRYNPMLREQGKNPFILDSPRPSVSLKDYAYNELRYIQLQRSNPEQAEALMQQAQAFVTRKWEVYEEMAKPY